MMKCEKARPFLPALAADRLDDLAAGEIHQHLAGCAVCRSSLEKSRRLRMLLSLKRHEQPDAFFFQTYLANFHRRLYSEMIQKRSVWSRIREAVSVKSRPFGWLLRASTAMAGIGLVLLGLYAVQLSVKNHTSQPVAHHLSKEQPAHVTAAQVAIVEVESHPNQLVLADSPTDKSAVYVLDRVTYKPSTYGAALLVF